MFLSDLFKDKEIKVNIPTKPKEVKIEPEELEEEDLKKKYAYLDNDENCKDFHEITPGTNRWLNFWRNHPDQQEEMLKYAKTRGYIFCVARQQRINVQLCPGECSCKNKDEYHANATDLSNLQGGILE